MIQDTAPHTFDATWRQTEPQEQDAVFAFRNRGVLAASVSPFRLPTADAFDPERLRYLFSLDGKPCFLATGPLPEGMETVPFERLKGPRSPILPLALATARHLAWWYGRNVFCGSCGKPMEHEHAQRALRCPSCGTETFPTIMPAVIVGLWHDDRILLTRYNPHHSAYQGPALIAGFCEIGESAEQTVAREVREEVGLDVRSVTYFGSQPWGTSGDLLLGYFCQPARLRTMDLETDELASARWTSRKELSAVSCDTLSLTGTMIAFFRDHEEDFR